MRLTNFQLKLKGKTAVFIDWANVYGWKLSKQKPVNPNNLYKYFRSYKEISEILFYFGEDIHPKSKLFLRQIRKIGFDIITKPVKYIPVSLDSSHFKSISKAIKEELAKNKKFAIEDIEQILHILDRKVLRRKCDFDIEIAMDLYRLIDTRESFIFLSGDGDFAPLFKFLADQKKQVIVIFGEGHLGREVSKLGNRVFLCSAKNIPAISDGA